MSISGFFNPEVLAERTGARDVIERPGVRGITVSVRTKPNLDIESQGAEEPARESTISTLGAPEIKESGISDNSNVPKMSLTGLFWFFFTNFGLFAWGGPVAQIMLLKTQLVMKDRWISLSRFQRVYAVYQILPGPEATKLCMFFGCLSAGRLGGVVAGFAFILPGFLLMILASYLYSLAGLKNAYFNASFKALQPIVAAMMLRATHNMAEHSLVDPTTLTVNPFLLMAAICTALNSALHINIFISLAVYGVIYAFIARRLWFPAALFFILQYIGFGLYVHFQGFPSSVSFALGVAKTPSLLHLFILGLVTGFLSFGGAYTAIPLIHGEAVLRGAWLPQNVFIDCLAISNIIPAPLTIFATFVGFQGGKAENGYKDAFPGAIIITIAIFLPSFIMTIAGHGLLERVVQNVFLSHFFDGLCGAVIGVVAVTTAQFLLSSVGGKSSGSDNSDGLTVKSVSQGAPAAVVCIIALATLYKYDNKYTGLLLIVSGAIAGQFLFL